MSAPDGMKLPPSDVGLEADLLAGCMAAMPSDVLGEIITTVEPADFYKPEHREIFDAITHVWQRGELVSPFTVSEVDHFKRSRKWLAEFYDEAGKLFGNAAMIAARKIVRLNQARESLRALASATERIYDGDDAAEVMGEAARVADRIRSDVEGLEGEVRGLTSSLKIVDSPTAVQPWVADGLIREMDRIVLIAGEGGGKSLLCRQFILLVAAGLHPLLATQLRNGPRRTMGVDLENRPGTIAHQLELVHRAMRKRGIEIPDVPILSRPNGLNVLDRVDRRQLDAAFTEVRPELVVIGPAYKLYRRGRDHESAILDLLSVLDDMQSRHGFALILEHHAPMATGGRDRELRPVDSSIWQRWPEAGLGMHSPVPNDNGSERQKLSQWRPPRDPMHWPAQLIRGVGDAPWPFTGNFKSEVVEGHGVPVVKAVPPAYAQGEF